MHFIEQHKEELQEMFHDMQNEAKRIRRIYQSLTIVCFQVKQKLHIEVIVDYDKLSRFH
jgi:hypothetical protein